MEIGYNNIDGIKYGEVKKQVERFIGKEMNSNTEFAFIEWFFESFNHLEHIPTGKLTSLSFLGYLKLWLNNKDEKRGVAYTNFLATTFVIKGLTTKQYIDYLELKQSRKQANRAFKTSLISIGVALLTGIMSWLLFKYSPQPAAPPFEVKIIEDKTLTPKLEKEVKELKEELYEAEILIGVYEEEEKSKKTRLKK